MIGRHHIGLLGASLLALGVVQIPPVPVDMTAAKQTIAELQQNGLDPLSIAAHAGTEGFVKLARAVLAMQHTQRAFGVEMTTPQLIAEVNALARPADTGRIDLQPDSVEGRQREAIQSLVVYDDLVTVKPTAEQRAKISAWYEKTLARGKVRAMPPKLREHAPVRQPKPAKEPRDRSAKRPEQSKARRERSAKKARRGW